MTEQVWRREILHPGIGASYTDSKTLYESHSTHQHLILFENPVFGKILMLDGVVQVTTRDEFVYHEMLTHVPLFSHEAPRKILIIGGGDGGILREVLRHQSVETVTMVEIDADVISFSRQYLPEISAGAFDNPKGTVIVDDGFAFVKNTEADNYDVIIVDSTDPQGPGEVLFSYEFYQHCHRILKKNGILVTQNGVPFLQSASLKKSLGHFSNLFQLSSCYRATIPTYSFGEMTLGFASDNTDYLTLSQDIIDNRFKAANLAMKYYNPAIHKAAFALPGYIADAIR